MERDLNQLWNYRLPKELIAQEPARPRSSARMLVYRRSTRQLEDRTCRDLPRFLGPGDLIVVNDARVIPARIHGIREKTGGRVTVFLLRKEDSARWIGWVRARRRLAIGERVVLPDGGIIVAGESMETDPRERVLEFQPPLDHERLLEIGEMPTPPYIKKKLEHPEDYQTLFAKREGALAAPTAGLHFDEPLIKALEAKEIRFASVTLILGPGSFKTLDETVPENLELPAEKVMVSKETCEAIIQTRKKGCRVLSVGTTVLRSLETAFLKNQCLAEFDGLTTLAIQPGFRFQATDALMTNFHLPRSSHLLLVAALIGPGETLRLYEHAIRSRYRFYSFGDALLIL